MSISITEQVAVERILNLFEVSGTSLIYKNISFINFLESLLTKKLSGYLVNTVRYKSGHFNDVPKGLNLSNYLLSRIGYKRCGSCNGLILLSEFPISNSKRYSICKECKRNKCKQHYEGNKDDYFAKDANRRASKLNATPSWSQTDKIKEFYRNRPKGFHVDHIVPLQSDIVCGLHVLENLQYLSASENLKKGNRLEV